MMGRTPSHFKGQNLPVEQVKWDDCKEFCKRTGLSLPTEAQWEYACRAVTQTPFSFGETITTDQVNYNGNSPYGGGAKGKYRERTVPVDALEPNGFGLYQMHGNVWEWCVDVFDAQFYSKREALEKDPVCTSGSGARVIRGGGWREGAGACRSAYRIYVFPSYRGDLLGFRPLRAVTL